MSFDLGSILSQYTGGNAAASEQDTSAHFGQVAQVAPAELVKDGLSAMFRSDATPSVGQMASQTYQQSTPTQQAGMLNQILAGLSPAAIASILGSLNGGAGAPAATQSSAQGGSLGGMLGSVLGSLAGGGQGGGLGGLGGILDSLGLGTAGSAGVPGVPPAITPDQASQITPDQVKDIANKAQEHNPGIVDVLSGFYVQHPDLVKSLGAAALAIAMGHMAKKTA
jgi:hypothetical protein